MGTWLGTRSVDSVGDGTCVGGTAKIARRVERILGDAPSSYHPRWVTVLHTQPRNRLKLQPEIRPFPVPRYHIYKHTVSYAGTRVTLYFTLLFRPLPVSRLDRIELMNRHCLAGVIAP